MPENVTDQHEYSGEDAVSRHFVATVYLIHQSLGQAVAAIFIGTLLMTYFHLAVLPRGLVLSWMGYMLFTGAIRLVSRALFFRRSPQGDEVVVWARSFVFLSALPGIDTAAGLAVTQDDAGLYRRLLVRFSGQQRDFVQRFLAARGDGDRDTMGRMAHTLKGVAGNLGIRGVQVAADALQRACETDAPAVEERLAAVHAALQPVLEGLRTLEDATQSRADEPIPYVDHAAVAPLLRELYNLVVNDDTNAAVVLEKLQPLFRGTGYADAFQAVASAVAEYDFDRAAEVLEELADELGMVIGRDGVLN